MLAHTPSKEAPSSEEKRGNRDYPPLLIAGGGLVGLTTAIALSKIGLASNVVDRLSLEEQKEAPFDGRSSALSRSSVLLFKALGLWEALEKHACPILKIEVTDRDVDHPLSPFSLLFDTQDETPNTCEPLGYIVENTALRTALLTEVEKNPLISFIQGEIDHFTTTPSHISLTLASGKVLSSVLLLACQGRNSLLREQAGIRSSRFSYKQVGFVATVLHEKPHNNLAFEQFMPSGPFALLPMVPDAQGNHRSSLVWSENERLASTISQMDHNRFSEELERRFGTERLGALKVKGKRWCYPLSAIHAQHYVKPRLALLGDSAHGIHPVAGQGFNLGLRDVAALCEVLQQGRKVGLDLGDLGLLQRYEQWRRPDNTSMALLCDSLLRLFSSENTVLRAGRNFGLGAVNRLPFARRFLMKHAMGTVGKRPKLLRGETL